jgi:holin-like protein
MIYAIAAMLMCQLLGELIVHLTALPLPGTLIGMALLFISLALLGKVPDSLEKTSSALFRHMMLFFIPLVTGVMAHTNRVIAEWLPFLASCVLGAALTIAATALSLQWMLARSRQQENP